MIVKNIIGVINKIANICIILISGIFCGAIATFFVLRFDMKNDFSFLYGNHVSLYIDAMFFAPSVLFVLIGLVMEFIKTNSKYVRYFQNNILHKLVILISFLMVLILVISSVTIYDRIVYGKYKDFAKVIVENIDKHAQDKRESVYIELNNTENIEYLLISTGYDIDKKGILKTGLLDKKLIEKINKKNPMREGLFIHLIKDGKVVATEDTEAVFGVENGFKIAKLNETFEISMRKKGEYNVFYIIGIK